MLAESYFGQLKRWLEVRAGESEDWQRAAFMGDYFLWVTADELTQIEHDLDAVTNKYFERQVKPELRPAGARLVTALRIAFPNVALPPEE